MQKRVILIGVLTVVAIVAGVIAYLYRPLPHPMPDPGEEYFTLPERELPSGLEELNALFPLEGDSPVINRIKMLDEKLQGNEYDEGIYIHDRTGDINYISSIDFDRFDSLVTGTSYNDMYGLTDELNDLLQQYDLYPSSYAPEAVIPHASGIQAFVRVAAAMATRDCLRGNNERCADTFETTLLLAQKMKLSGSMVSTLIGVVLESIIRNHIAYLENKADFPEEVKNRLALIDYVLAEQAYQNSIKSEYHMFQYVVNDVAQNVDKGDVLFTLTMGYTGTWDQKLRAAIYMILPKNIVFDRELTLSQARYLYASSINNTLIVSENADYNKLRYYRPGLVLLRNNAMGKNMIEALIPRLVGVLDRLYQSEQRYKYLILQENINPLQTEQSIHTLPSSK